MGVITLITISIAAMLILALGVVFFVILYQRRIIRHQEEIKIINDRKQLELIQASLQGEEQERMRIAAELHDDVGTTLASIRLFLHAAGKDGTGEDIIVQTKELLDETINKVRSISHKLQPALLQQLGLHASLESFTTMISKPGLVLMEYSGDELPRFIDNIELSIYRIVQELTNNAIRHAHATNIYIKTLVQINCLTVSFIHNGEGLTEEMYQEQIHKKGAIGLKNIVNRLKSIDATITFEENIDKLFCITITIPISKMQNNGHY